MHFITKCDTKLITLVNLHLLQILWHTFKSFLLLQNNSINRPSSLCDQLKLIDLNRVNLSPGFNFAENAVGWGMLRNEQQIWFARRPSIPFFFVVLIGLSRKRCNCTPTPSSSVLEPHTCDQSLLSQGNALSVCLSVCISVGLSFCMYICLSAVCLSCHSLSLFLCVFRNVCMNRLKDRVYVFICVQYNST